jgi:CspA family cold shock protein
MDAKLIQPTNGGRDAFVHVTAVRVAGLNGLNDGQKVTYEVVRKGARKRRQAS